MAKMTDNKKEIGLQILDLEAERQRLKKRDQKLREKIGKLRAEFMKVDEPVAQNESVEPT